MKRSSLGLLLCFALIALACVAAAQKAEKNSGAPDKAHLQKIWDGWSTLDPANVAQFYASGPHMFFDIAPLKYSSWDEYQKTVKTVLDKYQSGKCTVNDDAELHPAGKYTWGAATVKCEMMLKDGKAEEDTFRWTFVFEKQGGKWLTVHEHVSAPLP